MEIFIPMAWGSLLSFFNNFEILSNISCSIFFDSFIVLLNSSFNIRAFSSIIEIIESVIFTLVPLGILSETVTLSLATVGKKVTPIIPPPIDPIVNNSAATKPEKLKSLFFKAK